MKFRRGAGGEEVSEADVRGPSPAELRAEEKTYSGTCPRCNRSVSPFDEEGSCLWASKRGKKLRPWHPACRELDKKERGLARVGGVLGNETTRFIRGGQR